MNFVPSGGRSPDWVYSDASNAHLTNDRSWFCDDFTPLDSHISNSSASIPNIAVRGIGTVILPVKQTIEGQGTTAAVEGSSLRLENVLYVPDYPCNVVGGPVRSIASVQFSSMTPRGAMVYGDGSIAAVFMPGKSFYQITLRKAAGVPLGRSVLDEHPEYGFMSAFSWAETEQQRWRAMQSALRVAHAVGAASSGDVFGIPFSSGTGMDVDVQRGRKRGADDDCHGSPRSVKRSRAMDERDFGSRRILPAVFSVRG